MEILELFIALFIFILMILVSIEDLATGFLLLLTLIPLQHKELFSLVVWDILPIRIAFFGIFLASLYRLYIWFKKKKNLSQVTEFLKDPFFIILISLYLIRLLSILFVAENKIFGFKLLAFFSTMVYFYMLMKFVYQKHGFDFIKKSLKFYIFISFLLGLTALIQFYVFKIYDFKFGAIWEIPGHNPRIGSTFWDVNHFGAFVASAIPISLAFVFLEKKYKKHFYIINTLFLCLILYLTQSRSAWLGMGVSSSILVVLLFLKGFKKYAKYLALIGIMGFIGIISYFQFFGPGVIEKYKTFMHTRLDSFDTHFILLNGAYEVYTKKPLIGAGYGNFNEAFRETSYAEPYFFREKNIVDERVPSHSIWGEVISETGFLGFFAYTLFFFLILIFLLKGFFQSKKIDSVLPLVLISSIVSLLISGIFYTYNLEFFWLIAFFGVIASFYFNKNLSAKNLFDFLSTKNYLPLIFLVAFSSLLLFWGLGSNTLIDWDEAIYAEVSKNILETGDPFTLRWMGESYWFEKPPLYMWFSSAFMFIFGKYSEFAARLPSAVFGLLSVVFVYQAGIKLFKSRFVGLAGGLMLLTTADFLGYARHSMMDVTVGFFILASLYFAYRFFEDKKFYNALLSGAMCGFGVLTKAVVGLLPVPIIFIYILCLYFQKDKRHNLTFFIKGMLFFVFTFLLVSLPWHLYMYILHGNDFIDTYFKEHILNRGLTDQQGKTQPFWWYLIRIKVSMRYWFLLLIPSFLFTLYKIMKSSKNYIFLFIYSSVVFLFFSISNSKLIWYIIPLYPALALMNAAFLREALFYLYKKKDSILSYLNFKIVKIDFKSLLGIFSIIFSLTMFLYVLEIKALAYRVDLNKDLEAIIKDYNEKYYPGQAIDTLYYQRMADPVVRFYAKGEITATDRDPFTRTIENAPFDRTLVYISREGEYDYFKNIYGTDRVLESSQRGAYYLVYVRSLEEYYTTKAAELKKEIFKEITEFPNEENKQQEAQKIRGLQEDLYRYQEILHENKPEKYLPPIKSYFSY